MSAKTKIVVLRMKELIYTGIFVGLAILLVVIFLAMFRQKPEKSKEGENTVSDKNIHTNADNPDPSASSAVATYAPGIYTASLPLNSQSLDVEVTVDHKGIQSIRLIHLEDSVAAMYPLMEPAFDSLKTQILTNQSLEGITYEDTSKYTSYVLLQAIDAALKKAVPQ